MANGIEEALRERAESGTQSPNMPIVQVVVTVEEDLDLNDAQLAVASIRREAMAADQMVQNVTQDYTVDSFIADTASAIVWEDIRNVRSTLRNAVNEAGLTPDQVSVQADIQTPSL